MLDQFFLKEALRLAEKWQGQCAPNPSVGCVVVKANHIIAQGWHEGVGTAHAERMALTQVPGEKNLTVYVTLEPCNHWGKTPPCTDLIVQHGGVQRVVYAYRDPHPVVAKNGSSKLLETQGIEVVYDPLPEMISFYEAYAFWIKTKRPWINVKLALSLDGKIAEVEGKPIKLSNSTAAHFTHTQRKKSDVILTTARTVVRDNPALNVRLPGLEGTVSKKIALLDRRLILTYQEKVFKKNTDFIVFYDAALSVKQPHPACQYIPIMVQDNQLDLKAIFEILGEQGVHSIWVEAGETLFTSLHHQGLVQRTYLYVTPHVLGEKAIGLFHDKAVFRQQHAVSCKLLEDNALFILDWICLPD